MKTIYRSEEGKNRILALYDQQLSRLPVPWRDIYVKRRKTNAGGRT